MLKTEDYSSPECVIIDFGLAQHDADYKQQICGTPGYIPPETWQFMKWFPRGDTFSMGVTMLQLVIDQIPEIYEPPPPAPPQQVKNGIFGGGTIDDVTNKTCNMPAPLNRIPANMPGFKTFIAKCLLKDQAGRPKSHQALNDPWFTGAPAEVPESDLTYLTTTYSSPQVQVQPEVRREVMVSSFSQPSLMVSPRSIVQQRSPVVVQAPAASIRSASPVRYASPSPTQVRYASRSPSPIARMPMVSGVSGPSPMYSPRVSKPMPMVSGGFVWGDLR